MVWWIKLVSFAALSVWPVTSLAQQDNSAGFEERFEIFDGASWHRANYAFTHPQFDTDWDASLAEFRNGLTLKLIPQNAKNPFLGASIRRHEPTHYGRYEAELTAARGAGIITGFFLYTGPAYGTQHDEIDWEIFGQDTTTAQVAWWQNGILRSRKIDLGFDAAEGPNLYAIDWAHGHLRWFVNDTLVFETREAVPTTPQRLFANVWAVDPSLESWAGLAAPDTATQAKAYMLRHEPAAQPLAGF